ncbi:MAG: hypothetical protein A2V67_04030 [Deltaproteobacteria bacterium RBG_13_61_14]|nr:MAG: hypothetical protein A2V67_04030 [Deltaproteobacteria bacterium RBG_13_61_14]
MNSLLIILLIFGFATAIYLSVSLLNLRKQKNKFESELQSQIIRNQHLAKYEGIADADERAAKILRDAQETLEKAKADSVNIYNEANQGAQTTLEKANQEAKTVASEAREKAKTSKEEAKAQLDRASVEAAKIVQDANKRAEEIAGSAYEAMKNASLYEQTVKAMKNIIEGYGDQYIIPGHSLLDDLAQDFGHTQAGEELKKARERTRSLIRSSTAATCEYVEQNRRETATNFVLDAFNGKVDSSLSRVRHDNAGTLEQEIRDSFNLVNLNGKAFRDARITEEYLAARMDELKWAAVAQQLKLEEREEQRRIKEQIREEEKARREYERAMREAEKEEELLRKAMEKAQQQIEKATAEQKGKYEQQLQELSQRLKEAEERNQRAISMAQQTKRGHVYIISNIGSFGENVYKIGLTRRLEPLDRIRELGDSSVPFEFDVHALIFSDDAPGLENRLHKHLLLMQMNKVNYRKEFFKVDLKHIREEVEKMELAAKWTMTAEATEYRETLAIEKAIKENPAAREAWINKQPELKLFKMPEAEVAGISEE